MDIFSNISWPEYGCYLFGAMVLWYGGATLYFRSRKGTEDEVSYSEPEPVDDEYEE